MDPLAGYQFSAMCIVDLEPEKRDQSGTDQWPGLSPRLIYKKHAIFQRIVSASPARRS